MTIERFAAFSTGDSGGNPAAVVLTSKPESDCHMQALASQIGYSETVFATRITDGWMVRYFAPEVEVRFCGHATLALGACLARHYGSDRYRIVLNDNMMITVEGQTNAGRLSAAFYSPPTRTEMPSPELVASVLSLFGFAGGDLDCRLPPTLANAGANHLIISLNDRERLRAMQYDFILGRELMKRERLTTIMLVYEEHQRTFQVRNAFAAGGIYEDPATGAAAAAFAGYLGELEWLAGGQIIITQGEDMKIPCRICVDLPGSLGSSVRVSGEVRVMSS